MPERLARRVLLIGWDAADWKFINPLIERGLMPTLERFIDTGVIGNIATLHPILSPMLWNSIATGKRAYQHGILGFVEPDPHSGGVRPVSSTSRKVKAIWNILTQSGIDSNVVSWFAGHPVEPINGVAVSPLFAASRPEGKPLPPDTIHPQEFTEIFRNLYLAPSEIGAAEILPFIPRAAELDPAKDRLLQGLRRTLSECCSVHNAATWILQNRDWEFTAVYYNAIDHFGHLFMPFQPPRRDHVPERLFEIYKDVMTSVYRFHDMMLEALLTMVGDDTTVILVSDHGFYSDEMRPHGGDPVSWHRPQGIIGMRGPGILKDERIYGASLLDITPTILTLFGLPAGDDMPGKPLLTAFAETPSVSRIPTWEAVEGECGMHSADTRLTPEAAKAIIDQFVALGYMEAPSENQAKAVERCLLSTHLNLAQDLIDSGKNTEAIELLTSEKLGRLGELLLARAYLANGRAAEAIAILESNQDQQTGPWVNLMLGAAQLDIGNIEASLKWLRKAEQAEPRLPTLHVLIGNVYARTREWVDAERAYQYALEIDAECPDALIGLATVRLAQRRNEEASELALNAVGLRHFNAFGHYVLGRALVRIGHWNRAILALDTALSMAPAMGQARRLLGAVYARNGKAMA
jgi:predicted AlkP superfamily phosphohydrolase/phosphomutase/tetratricopeptide (TPR) repeat protein